MRGYIEDGYQKSGFIAESKPNEAGDVLHDSLDFTYRPATRLEVIQIDQEVKIALRKEDSDPKAYVKSEEIACKFVASHLKEWSVESSKGPVLPTKEACGRLHPLLFQALYTIIRGERLSDVKPGEPEPTSDEDDQKN